MNREKLISIVVTEDEKREILKKMGEKQMETGKRMSLSSFIREFAIMPLLNGDSSPPQETKIEEPTEKGPWDDIEF